MAMQNLLILCILALIFFTIVNSEEQREIMREGGVTTTYCVAYAGASSGQLQGAINYVCSKGVNSNIIKPGGSCYNPNTLVFHASAVLNAYFKAHGSQGPFCAEGPLKNIGELTFTDPSQGSCRFS